MKKPISILKAIKGKPSIALQHMVDGLLKQSRRKKFRIEMGSFGNYSRGICFGCAATCAIQHITKINFTPDSSILDEDARAMKMKVNNEELNQFESAIDDARFGWLESLFLFCNLPESQSKRFSNSFSLNTDDWKEQIPNIRKTIEELKIAGY